MEQPWHGRGGAGGPVPHDRVDERQAGRTETGIVVKIPLDIVTTKLR